MKTKAYFDLDEQEAIVELAKSITKKEYWCASGNMLVMYSKESDEYEVYLLRGIVKLSKKEKNQKRKW